MKKTLSKSMSWILSVVIIFGFFIVPASIQVSATQSRKENFSKNYTTVSDNPGQTVANIAYAQIGKSGSALGYTEDWCADFVSDCAELAGQSAAVPRHGRADYIDEYILNAGGYKVSAANAKPGDIAFYDFNGNNSPEHVEIVYSVSGSTVKTVGGNTGNNNLYYATVCSPRSPGSLLYIIRPNYKTQIVSLSAPVVTVTPGTSVTPTKISWNSVANAKTYDLRIWSTSEDIWSLTTTSYEIILPAGEHRIQVAAVNGSSFTYCNEIKFTVKSGGTDIGNKFYAQIIHLDKVLTQQNANVVLSTNKYLDSQIWYFEKVDGLYYKITNKANNECLDVAGAGTANGTNIGTYASNDTAAQRWCFVRSCGNIIIIPKVSGRVALDLKGGCLDDGTNIQVWERNGTFNQEFVVLTPTYTISYNMNGGSGSISNQTKTYGQDLTLSSTKPTRTGYSFLGWDTNKSATTAKYSSGGKYTANSGATLYAIWSINKYTISYNMNGGSGSIGNQTKTYGQDLTLSSTKPTRTGYDFVGWNTNKDATTAQYSSGSKYTANSGATLYAIWKAKQIKVTFYRNLNSDDTTTASQTFTYGASGQSFSNKNWTKDGYTLLGWSSDRNATTASYSVLSTVSNDWIKDNAPTKNLYAVWKRIDENLGIYKYANPNKTTLYVRISYNGTDKYLTNLSDNASNDKSYKNIQLKTKNDSLQQVWEFEKLSDGGYKISSVYDGRILDIYQTKTDHGTNIGACGTYYANGGQIWYIIKKDGKYVIQPKISTSIYLGVANTNDGDNVQVTNSSHQFNIEILKPVGTSTMKVTQEGTSTSPTKFTWTAATDATWYNLYIYDGEVWKSNCIYGQKNIKGLEWSVQLKPGTYQAHLSPINIHNWTNSNVVSFTVKENKYTMNYNANGGTGTMNTQTLIFGENFTIPENKFVKTGYDFCYFNVYRNSDGKWYTSDGHGWQTESEINRLGYSKRKYLVGENHTMNKIWTSGAESDLSFTFYPVWKISAPTDKPVISNLKDTYSEGSDLTFTWNKVERTAKYWVRVWHNPGTESTKIVNEYITANSYSLNALTPGKYGIIIEAQNDSGIIDSDLYNFYVPFTIKYDLNGGTGTISPTYKKMDIACNLSSTIPTRTGYEFVGWNTNKSAASAQYSAGAKYTTNGNVTLYAIWKAQTYITYYMNDGSNDIFKKVTNQDVILNTVPERTGYSFVGWNTNKDATTAQYLPGSKCTINSNVNLYAIWEKIPVINSSTISDTKITLGDKVTITAKASGGTGSYTYGVYYKKASAEKWSTAQSYKANATISFKPAAAVKYDVCVKVKDSEGTIAKQYFTVNVTTELVNSSIISAETVKKGSGITVTAKATGGTGKYTYGVYYKKATSEKWTTAQSYGTNTTVTIKPAAAVKYNICVKVKDSSGKIVKRASLKTPVQKSRETVK